MFSGPIHGLPSLVPLLVPGPLRSPKARSWRFGVRGVLSLILLWDGTDRFGIRGAHSMAPLWSGADLTAEGSLGNWAGFISLGIPFLSFVRGKFPPDFAFYIRRLGRTILLIYKPLNPTGTLSSPTFMNQECRLIYGRRN